MPAVFYCIEVEHDGLGPRHILASIASVIACVEMRFIFLSRLVMDDLNLFHTFWRDVGDLSDFGFECLRDGNIR